MVSAHVLPNHDKLTGYPFRLLKIDLGISSAVGCCIMVVSPFIDFPLSEYIIESHFYLDSCINIMERIPGVLDDGQV
jgi:hypothetical protein